MFGQFLAVLFAIYYLIANFWMPIFQRFYTNDITLPFVTTAAFDLMLPGVFIVLLSEFLSIYERN
jgi:hypothetical protein